MQLIGGFRKTCERLWRLVIFGLTISCSIALSACAAPTQYMGIEFDKPVPPNSLQALASHARTGDKRAQLKLGILFEEGRGGVPRDLERAKKLYALAAKDTPITQTTFVPDGGVVKSETTHMGVRKGLDDARLMLAAHGLIGSRHAGVSFVWPTLGDEQKSRVVNPAIILRYCYSENGSKDIALCDDTKLSILLRLVKMDQFFQKCRYLSSTQSKKFFKYKCVVEMSPKEISLTRSNDINRLIWKFWKNVQFYLENEKFDFSKMDEIRNFDLASINRTHGYGDPAIEGLFTPYKSFLIDYVRFIQAIDQNNYNIEILNWKLLCTFLEREKYLSKNGYIFEKFSCDYLTNHIEKAKGSS